MAVFTVSDIIVVITLLVNAAAVLSSHITPPTISLTAQDESVALGPAVTLRIRTLIRTIRQFSVLIVAWNVIFSILLVFVFN
jgi:hypothetical protein